MVEVGYSSQEGTEFPVLILINALANDELPPLLLIKFLSNLL